MKMCPTSGPAVPEGWAQPRADAGGASLNPSGENSAEAEPPCPRSGRRSEHERAIVLTLEHDAGGLDQAEGTQSQECARAQAVLRRSFAAAHSSEGATRRILFLR